MTRQLFSMYCLSLFLNNENKYSVWIVYVSSVALLHILCTTVQDCTLGITMRSYGVLSLLMYNVKREWVVPEHAHRVP